MRILLIATNRHNRWMSREEVRPLPLGLAYVAAAIDPERHPLRVLDLMFADDYLAATRAAVEEFEPQLVGISLRNLDNGSYVNPQSALPVTKEVIQQIRHSSDAVIICGGPAFSILPQECFNYLMPDVGLAGDAAESFAELADLLERKQSYRDLPGVVYRDKGEIRAAPERAGSWPNRSPRLEELDLDQYREAGFGVGVITKLGWYPSTMNAPNSPEDWRMLRPVFEVIKEVQRLQKRHGIREFFFIDQAFNQPIEYAKDLCQNLIEAGLDIKWNTNLVPQGCDQNLIDQMVQSGCQMVLMGGGTVQVPTTPGESIDNLQFATHMAELQRLCDFCHAAGLRYAITQGFGEPGETDRTIRTKLAFLSTAAAEGRAANVNLRVGTRLLPGSELVVRAMQEGIVQQESDLLMPVFYVEPSVRNDLMGILEEAVAGNPSWQIM